MLDIGSKWDERQHKLQTGEIEEKSKELSQEEMLAMVARSEQLSRELHANRKKQHKS